MVRQKALDEEVVPPRPFSVHTDPDLAGGQNLDKIQLIRLLSSIQKRTSGKIKRISRICEYECQRQDLSVVFL
jgi:hypothetical protein